MIKPNNNHKNYSLKTMNNFMKIKLITSLFFFALSANIFAENSFQQKLKALETTTGGRIGVAAINTANNERLQYRANERFPFCSTYKVIGVSAILKQSMIDGDLLQSKITYNKNDLVVYSPVTEKHLADGMTVAELCEATLTKSDNTAINLLMKKLGGVSAVNNFAHSIGDETFRLDRIEPDLNTAIPGDLRDTSTPASMQQTLQQLALGNVLGSGEREQLQQWLKNNTTGNLRIRAGVPKDWIVGDKTGTGDYGSTNDIAVIWPKNCSPIVMTIFFTQNQKDAAPRNDVIASITRILVEEFARHDKCISNKNLT